MAIDLHVWQEAPKTRKLLCFQLNQEWRGLLKIKGDFETALGAVSSPKEDLAPIMALRQDLEVRLGALKEKIIFTPETLADSLTNNGLSLVFPKEKWLAGLRGDIQAVKEGRTTFMQTALVVDGCDGLRLTYDDPDHKFVIIAFNDFSDLLFEKNPKGDDVKLKKIAQKYHQKEVII